MGYEIYILAIFLSLNIYMLFDVYIRNKCSCENSIYRKVIVAYLTINTTIMTCIISLFFIDFRLFRKISKVYMVAAVPFTIGYTILTYLYLESMIKKDCDCVHHPALPYVAIANSVITSLNAFYVIVIAIIAYIAYRQRRA